MDASSIRTLLDSLGLRLTKARLGIIHLLSKSTKPVAVDVLVSRLNLNKTTIYREMDTLLKKGVVIDIDFGDGKKRYELASYDHHHHLICISCHGITDVKFPDDLQKEEKAIKLRNNFHVIRHSLEFFGVCHKCQD